MLTCRSLQKPYGGREQVFDSSSYHCPGNRPHFKSTKLGASHLQSTKVDSQNFECSGVQILKNSRVQSGVALPAKPAKSVAKHVFKADAIRRQMSPTNMKVALPAKPAKSVAKHVFKADAIRRQMSPTNMKVSARESKSENLTASGASVKTSCHPMLDTSSHPLPKIGKGICESEYQPRGYRGHDCFSSSKSGIFTDGSSRVQPKLLSLKVKTHQRLSKDKILYNDVTWGEARKNVCPENVVKGHCQLRQVNGDKTCRESEFTELSKTKSALKMAFAGSGVSKLNSTSDVSPAPSSSNVAGSCRKVLMALKQFQELYLKLLQEEKQSLKGQANATTRNCIKAAMVLKREGKWINSDKDFGNVPGIEFGDKFQFRAELSVVGLHHHFVSGISYTRIGDKIYAISIVNSGRYENVTKSADVFIYTGQGGNPNVTNKKAKDQKMVRGNLALKNSMDMKVPVRVIHGRKPLKASDNLGISNGRGLVYVYDGLYTVNRCWVEREQFGKLAFKYEMKRFVK